MLRCMTQLDVVEQATDFDRTTLAEPVPGRPGEFTVELDAGWSSLVGVHGGYLCALAVCGVLVVVLVLGLAKMSLLLGSTLSEHGFLSLRLVLLRRRSKTRRLLRGGKLLRSNSLLCRSLPGRSRQRSLGLCRRRVLRSLACLRFLALFINIKARLTVQTHAAKLHGGAIDCVVSRHDDCLLLLLHSALEACAPASCGGCTVGADGKAADRWAANGRLLLARNGCEVTRIG